MISSGVDPLLEKLNSTELSSADPSPALSRRTVPSPSGLDLDLSLPTALSNLIQHLISPLVKTYPPKTLAALRLRLTAALSGLYAPTWNYEHPQHGSGFRSLICTRQFGLPAVLKQAAEEVGVSMSAWIEALARTPDKEEDEPRSRGDEWEAWCDPGTVVWRYGGWEWEDLGYEPSKVVKEPYQIIWQTSPSPRPAPPSTSNPTSSTTDQNPSTSTPVRPSHAIAIRAPVPLPAVFAIPPTPATNSNNASVPPPPSPSLLPPASISRSDSPTHSDASSGYGSVVSAPGKNHSRASSHDSASTDLTKSPSRASHRGSGSGSTSSVASTQSDASGTMQLLTPDTRPPSTDMFNNGIKGKLSTTGTLAPARGRSTSPNQDLVSPSTAASVTPTVTPYDGGNVTVLGGGVKLGGGSRPSSVMSTSRTSYDRARSPSISLASRALTSAMGPNGVPTGNPRKARTRRRIMPTYLGHLGQPGVGGPVMGAFGQYTGGAGYPPTQATGPWQGGSGVGVGVAPPPVSNTGRPPTGPGASRVSSA